MSEVVITHRITKDRASTTVETPWSPPITKSWSRVEAGHFRGDFDKGWDEEDDLPPEVQRAADESVTSVCSTLEE